MNTPPANIASPSTEVTAPFATLPAPKKAEFDAFDKWATPYPQAFQSQLAAFVNLADSYQQEGPSANADRVTLGVRAAFCPQSKPSAASVSRLVGAAICARAPRTPLMRGR